MRRRCPADNCAAFTFAKRPSIRMRAMAVATSSCVAPTVLAQNSMFCFTVRSKYKPFWWPNKPTRERMSSLCVARSLPNTRPMPRSIGSRPAHTRRTDVLPAPFGPCNRTISPRCTDRLTPASAGKPPSTATTSFSSITVSMRASR